MISSETARARRLLASSHAALLFWLWQAILLRCSAADADMSHASSQVYCCCVVLMCFAVLLWLRQAILLRCSTADAEISVGPGADLATDKTPRAD